MGRHLICLINGTKVSANQASEYQGYSNVYELAYMLQLHGTGLRSVANRAFSGATFFCRQQFLTDHSRMTIWSAWRDQRNSTRSRR